MDMRLPRLGMGTWHMGESRAGRASEVAALRLGLDLGVTLIDTAEMYGDGGAEEVVGEAIRGRRDAVFLVSKFYPHHASRTQLQAACEASLARLGTDRLDLYLYHWRGLVPLKETVPALEALVAAGKIARWGVSNFDVADLEELAGIPGGEHLAANQVLYNLERRGIEFDLLPWCAAQACEVMAYSPLDEGPLARHPKLLPIAQRLGVTPAQLALAWVMRHPGLCAIPKASKLEHVRANHAAAGLALDDATLRELDAAFPPPKRKLPLAII
jgi:diketogulonate reductase-like aldo/keto reductase